MSLSKEWSQRQPRYDFVIVGSGYGGSITAARIASATGIPRQKVCILERGKEWPVGEFPDTIGGYLTNLRTELTPLGLYEARAYRDITVIKGCGP
jgi:cholesterol oxidase